MDVSRQKKLSIVIVNYNVRFFLEQTLASVYRSKTDFDFEVWVVDNHSTDDSLQMLAAHFPQVQVIANADNKGFSAANNQAIRQAAGQYILLLNPDTIIQEDTLQKCVHFMDAHPDAGALGVRMVDGTGRFLPESKRGFPSPWAALSKMSGLSALFPHSRWFGQYHLSYLDENENHEVDVLSGAFMLLRADVLGKVGLLDEDYFMYGEDIDLSYCIKKAGYKNYYFADTSIIHFKGESTKKGSLNYVRMFYQAMLIFTGKHMSGTSGRLLSVLLHVGIYLRALLAIFQKMLLFVSAPVVDVVAMACNLYVLHLIWENLIKWHEHVVFPATFFYVNMPIYIGCWLFAMWMSGVYDKNAKWIRLLTGLVAGTFVIAVCYAFFPNFLRTSRGVIVLGMLSNFIVLFFLRIGYKMYAGQLSSYFSDVKNLVIVGSRQEAFKVWDFIELTGLKRNFVGFLCDEEEGKKQGKWLGAVADLDMVIDVYGVEEVIFCADKVGAQAIIAAMCRIGDEVEYKIASANSMAIVGSNSKDTAGDLYTFDSGFNLNKPLYRRMKRVTDLLFAMAGLLSYPIMVFFVKKEVAYIRECVSVLLGNKTWVGYNTAVEKSKRVRLPQLQPSVFSVSENIFEMDAADTSMAEQEYSQQEKIHILYAKEYSPWKDVQLLLRNLFF